MGARITTIQTHNTELNMSALQNLSDHFFFSEDDSPYEKLKVIDQEISNYSFYLRRLVEAKNELLDQEKETFDIIKEF